MTTPSDRPRVVVIGAGLAGLSAARDLVNSGRYDVTILEARPDRIGGRTWTCRIGENQTPVDLGASYIHISTKKNTMTLLARRHNVDVTDMTQEDQVTYSEDRRSKISGIKIWFKSIKYGWGLYRVMKKADSYETDVSVRDAIIREGREKELLGEPEGLLLLSTMEANFAAPMSEVSVKLVQKIETLEKKLKDGESSKEEMVTKGYVQIVDGLAKGVEGETPLDIKLGTAVTTVSVAQDASEVTLTTHSNETLTCAAVVVTVPLGVLKSDMIQFEPPLPEPKMQAIKNLGFGVFNKLVLEFSTIFWPRKKMYFTIAPSNESSSGLLNIWVNGFFITGQPVLIGFLIGEQAIKGEDLSDENLLQTAVDKLNLMFGNQGNDVISVSDIKHHQRSRWLHEEYSRGSYTYPKIGNDGSEFATIAEPVGKSLFFAGEHTHSQWASTTTGAYLSGQRAAQEIRDVLG